MGIEENWHCPHHDGIILLLKPRVLLPRIDNYRPRVKTFTPKFRRLFKITETGGLSLIYPGDDVATSLRECGPGLDFLINYVDLFDVNSCQKITMLCL